MTGLTRRHALVAVATAPLALRAADAPAAASTDAAVVSELLRAELLLQRSYELCAASGPRRVRALARRFRAHEVEHAAALAQALEALGGRGLTAPRTRAEVEAAARSLGVGPSLTAARSRRGRLRHLLALEERVLGALHAALGRLDDDKLLQTVATILGCQAQHLVVLRTALGRRALPRVLDAGRP